MYVQLSCPLTMTTMRTPAALSDSRRRRLPSSWLPTSRVSVAPVSESVVVLASPLSAAWTLWPLEERVCVTSETAASRDGAAAFAFEAGEPPSVFVAGAGENKFDAGGGPEAVMPAASVDEG